jgi:hypothetical protein
MAKGKKTGGRGFQKGHKFSTGPRLPDEIKKARELSTNEFVRIANLYRTMTVEQVEVKIKNRSTTEIFEVAIMAWLMRSANGDYQAFELFLQRLIGKIPAQAADAESLRIMEQIQYLKRLPKEELKRLVAKVTEEAKPIIAELKVNDL